MIFIPPAPTHAVPPEEVTGYLMVRASRAIAGDRGQPGDVSYRGAIVLKPHRLVHADVCERQRLLLEGDELRVVADFRLPSGPGPAGCSEEETARWTQVESGEVLRAVVSTATASLAQLKASPGKVTVACTPVDPRCVDLVTDELSSSAPYEAAELRREGRARSMAYSFLRGGWRTTIKVDAAGRRRVTRSLAPPPL